MKRSTFCLIIALMAAAPLLSACSASCDCPKCPSHTTVVTPPNSTTTTYPNE